MFKWFWEALFVVPQAQSGFEVHSKHGFNSMIEAFSNLKDACYDGTLFQAGVPDGAQALDIILVFKKE